MRHHGATLRRHFGGGQHQLVGLVGILGVLLDGRGQFLDRGGGFFERAGLLFGARRQILVAGGDFARRAGNRIGADLDLFDDLAQRGIHRIQCAHQIADLVVALGDDHGGQIARSDLARDMNGMHQGHGNAARNQDGKCGAEQDQEHRQADGQLGVAFVGAVDRDGGLVDALALHREQRRDLVGIGLRQRQETVVESTFGTGRVTTLAQLGDLFLRRLVLGARCDDVVEQVLFLVRRK